MTPLPSVALAPGQASARHGALIVNPQRLGDVHLARQSNAALHLDLAFPAPPAVTHGVAKRARSTVPALTNAEKHEYYQ